MKTPLFHQQIWGSNPREWRFTSNKHGHFTNEAWEWETSLWKYGFDSPLWKTWGNLNYWLNWLNHQTCGNLTTQTNDFWLKKIWLACGQSQWRLAAILASPLDDRSREIHGDLGIPHDLRTPPGLGWTSCYPNYCCGWHWLTLYQPFRALSREFVFKLENDQELTTKIWRSGMLLLQTHISPCLAELQ